MAEQVELTVTVNAYKQSDDKPEIRPAEVSPEWDRVSDMQREGILCLVRDGLLDLIGRAEEWVPTSFVGDNGDRMDVQITFDLEIVDKLVLSRQVEADRALDDARAELRKMQERFGVG